MRRFYASSDTGLGRGGPLGDSKLSALRPDQILDVGNALAFAVQKLCLKKKP